MGIGAGPNANVCELRYYVFSGFCSSGVRMNVPRVTEISGSQWHQIVNGATETAIISTDQQGNVTSWNTGASRLLGWTEEEMLGQSLSRIFGEEEPGARLNREIDDAVRHGRGG